MAFYVKDWIFNFYFFIFFKWRIVSTICKHYLLKLKRWCNQVGPFKKCIPQTKGWVRTRLHTEYQQERITISQLDSHFPSVSIGTGIKSMTYSCVPVEILWACSTGLHFICCYRPYLCNDSRRSVGSKCSTLTALGKLRGLVCRPFIPCVMWFGAEKTEEAKETG